MRVQGGGETDFDVSKTSFSKHLVMTGVSATGQMSLRLVEVVFLGIRMILADFKQRGMTAHSRDRLKISVKTCDSTGDLSRLYSCLLP